MAAERRSWLPAPSKLRAYSPTPHVCTQLFQEVNWICAHPVIQDVAVVDPVFNVGPDYLLVLAALKAGGYRGRLSLQCR